MYWRKTLPDEYKTYPIDSIPLKLRHNAYVPYINDIYTKINVLEQPMNLERLKQIHILIDNIIKNGLEYKANSIYDLLAYGIYHTLKEAGYTDINFHNLIGGYHVSVDSDGNKKYERKGGFINFALRQDSGNELSNFQLLYLKTMSNEEYKKMIEYAQMNIDDIPDDVKILLMFMVRYC